MCGNGWILRKEHGKRLLKKEFVGEGLLVCCSTGHKQETSDTEHNRVDADERPNLQAILYACFGTPKTGRTVQDEKEEVLSTSKECCLTASGS
jgi:hypothetical protein